jgi:hypothetical protein
MSGADHTCIDCGAPCEPRGDWPGEQCDACAAQAAALARSLGTGLTTDGDRP